MFNSAQKTKFSEIGSSPYCRTTLRWLQANADPPIRNTILSFLLHPLIRSYRVRSILGRRSHKRVFDNLKTFQLTQDGGDIPQVLGIYALHASRISEPAAGDPLKDPAYVGKAGAVTLDNAGSILMPRRAKEHFRGIDYGKQKISATARDNRPGVEAQNEDLSVLKRKRLTWYHEQLADNSLGPVHLAVLTTFPLPEIEKEDYYLYLDFLLALAESIDAVFLGTLDSDINPFADLYATWYGKAHRPKDMPAPAFRGLNRALPLKQGCKPFGAHAMSLLCSRSDMNTFIQVTRDHETAIYGHLPTRPIRWERIASLLRERGVNKDKAQIRNIYDHRSRRPQSGFISYKLSKWRFIWNELYFLKQYLDQNGVVHEPKDENNLFFHIPALEEGCETSWDVQRMLRRSGFRDRGDPEFMPSFLTQYLPSLLHPMSANDAIPRIKARQFLEIWYCVQAQLLADGVPRDRLKGFGPL